jgi:hypothetical protein
VCLIYHFEFAVRRKSGAIDQRICTFEIFVRTLFWFDHREQRHWRNHKSSGADHGDVAEQCAVDTCILDLLMYRCNLATLFSSPPYLHFVSVLSSLLL